MEKIESTYQNMKNDKNMAIVIKDQEATLQSKDDEITDLNSQKEVMIGKIQDHMATIQAKEKVITGQTQTIH